MTAMPAQEADGGSGIHEARYCREKRVLSDVFGTGLILSVHVLTQK
jgi:hypothetical protein